MIVAQSKPAAPASYGLITRDKLDRLVNADGAQPLMMSVKTPFVMLRFIFGKAAWLTPRSSALCDQVAREPDLKFAGVERVAPV
jgi:hypothetical protein